MTRLPRQLVEALRQVRVDLSASTAGVGRHDVRADSPDALRRRLSTVLYDQLHARRGDWRPGTSRELTDDAFETRLRAEVPHHHTLLVATVGAVSTDAVVVTVDGVRLRLPVSGVDTAAVRQVVQVTVDCVRPRLSPGFLLVDGAAGNGLGDGPVLRVYLNVQTAEGAPELFGATLGTLERLAVPYRAKIMSVRAGLPRQDAAVVYLGRRAWHAAAMIADVVRDVAGRGDRVSPYTKRLGPGVSAAWEPTDPRSGYRGLSFGEHRSLVISTALVEHAKNPSSAPETVIEKELRAAGIDTRAPFRDVTSPDLTDILAPTHPMATTRE